MADFSKAIDFVLAHEGGEANIPGDSGLITKYGISLVFVRQNIKPDATDADIKNLTLIDAKNIYLTYFWRKNNLDKIRDQAVANRIFDLIVNMGAPQAVTIVQRAVNDCGSQIKVDGILGSATLAAINAPRVNNSIYNAIIYHALKVYIQIAKRAQNLQFLPGWITRLIDTPQL